MSKALDEFVLQDYRNGLDIKDIAKRHKISQSKTWDIIGLNF